MENNINNNFKTGDIITFVDNEQRKHISVLKNIYSSVNLEMCIACKIDIVLNAYVYENKADEINLTTTIYEVEINSIKYATETQIHDLYLFLLSKQLIYNVETQELNSFEDMDMLVINTDGECLITLFNYMDSCKSRIYAYGTINKYSENSCRIMYCAAIIKNIDSIRFANDDEKQLFETMFLKEDLQFNSDKKQFVEVRWRAEKGKPYYGINFNYTLNYDNGMTISKFIERNSKEDNLRFEKYNYFRTNDIGKIACKNVFTALKYSQNNELI